MQHHCQPHDFRARFEPPETVGFGDGQTLASALTRRKPVSFDSSSESFALSETRIGSQILIRKPRHRYGRRGSMIVLIGTQTRVRKPHSEALRAEAD